MAKKKKAATPEQLWRKLTREKHGPISREHPPAVEDFLKENGLQRRCALAVLTRRFGDLAKSIKSDLEGAKAMALLAAGLEDVQWNYTELANYMKVAQTRLLMALCGRRDGPALLKQARKQVKEANNG